MNLACQAKWERLSTRYDLTTWADARRFGSAKRTLLAKMRGRCLMVAAGTGADFRYFPSGLTIIAIDISPGMVARARERAAEYQGTLEVEVRDVEALPYADGAFDTVVTSCTLCSVRDPVHALRELYRCLRPGGQLLMFEHVRSRLGPIAIVQDLMTPITWRFGPAMNRDTMGNIQRAGFEVSRETNVYLDVVKTIEARRPLPSPNGR